jgi:hypothetical protein
MQLLSSVLAKLSPELEFGVSRGCRWRIIFRAAEETASVSIAVIDYEPRSKNIYMRLAERTAPSFPVALSACKVLT